MSPLRWLWPGFVLSVAVNVLSVEIVAERGIAVYSRVRRDTVPASKKSTPTLGCIEHGGYRPAVIARGNASRHISSGVWSLPMSGVIIDPETPLLPCPVANYGLRRIRTHAVDPPIACGVEPHFIAESRYEYGGG